MIKLESTSISVNNAGYYHTSYKYNSITRLHDFGKMHGPRRVAVFCLLTAVLPTLLIIIPLYLRHSLFADVYYQVAESDIFEIHEGMSSVFCEEHTLTMNNSFNAYQLSSLPEINNNRKHIRLKKSMELPDDTLEYWGFYLLKGSTVALKVCSRHEGSKILVVRGERNLRTCGLLEHNKNKPNYDKEYKQVKVTFETPAQEIIDSQERFIVTFPKNNSNNLDKSVNQNDINTGGEIQDAEDDLDFLQQQAEDYIRKHNKNGEIIKNMHNKRHARRRFHLEQEAEEDGLVIRGKRDVPNAQRATRDVPNAQRAKRDVPNAQRAKRDVPNAQRANRDVPNAQRANRDVPNAQRANRDVPNAQRANRDVPNAQRANRDVPNAQRANRDVPNEQRANRDVPNAQRANRDVSNAQRVKRSDRYEEQRNLLEKELNEDINRVKRETGHKLDGAIGHGGNAINHTADPTSGESGSQSSFETNLLDCYDGQILLSQDFPPSNLCEDIHYLARGEHMQMIHEVSSDGYYYYIFYSDNDLEVNHIHAVFDIHKPTFRYTNVSDTKTCVNSTECNFSVSFFSDETVIVEVPTNDGIEHEDDDVSMLVSKCKPRMAIYIIFPITILFLILGCAFL